MTTKRSRAKPEPKTRSSDRTRALLLTAAKTLFAKNGLHGVTVAEIGAAAGVSTAMINHHFGGKLELYRACLEGFAQLRLRVIEKFLVAPASFEEFRVRLELLVTELFDLHIEHREIATILLRDLGISDLWGEGVERVLYEFTPRFARFFELAKKADLLRADVNPLTAASMIYLTLSGLLQADLHRARVTGQSLTNPTHRAQVVRQILDVTLNGVVDRRHRAI